LQERDGVAAAWFARHGVLAALVRPDHYVFGVAADAMQLATLRDQLSTKGITT
jgi:3-(3-hydroxy-phenyl)propionate hydroxylase